MRQPPLLNRSSLCIAIAIVGSALGHSAPTLAQSSEAAPAATAAPSTNAAPPPYSLPWQLRPAAISTSLRSDTSFAFYDNAAHHGALTIPTLLTACYKLSDAFAPMLRVGVVDSSPGSGAKLATGAPLGSAVAVTNPIVGGTYLLKLRPDLRLAFFLGASIPIGSGGGNKPDAATKAARLSGIPARSSMDNALFTADDFAIIPGLDLAYVDHGLTVQAEASVLQLTRVRGDQVPAPGKPASNPDASKTNLILGLHVGYFLVPALSVGAELRHQRWLSTPALVRNDLTGSQRDNTTVALGVRFHLHLSKTIWLRPGVSFSRGLDNPLAHADYSIVQLDVPVQF